MRQVGHFSTADESLRPATVELLINQLRLVDRCTVAMAQKDLSLVQIKLYNDG